jgi:hypothetical protein
MTSRWYSKLRLQIRPEAIISHPEWEVHFNLHATLPFVFSERKLLIFASPKAGITTISKWAFQNLGILDEAFKYHPWIHKYRTEVYPQKFQVRMHFEKLLEDPETTIIKVIRNPYERLVSSYYHALKHQLLPKEGGCLHNFETFLNCLANQRMQDPHLQLQLSVYEHLMPDLKPEFIQLEKLEKALNSVAQRFDLPYGFIPEMGESKHHIKKGPHQFKEPLHQVSGERLFDAFPTDYFEFFKDTQIQSLANEILQTDLQRYVVKDYNLSVG